MRRGCAITGMLAAFFLAAAAGAAAQEWAARGASSGGYVVSAVVDHADGLYKPGEKVTFTIRLTRDGKAVTDTEVAYEVVGNGALPVQKGAAALGPDGATVVVEHPGPVCLTLAVRYKVDGKDEILYKAGAVVDMEGLRPVAPEPPDFDAFWAAQKKRLADTPMNVRLTPVSNDPVADKYPGVEVESFDVQADCPGGAPFSGYYARPKGAKPKSLPATIHFHSAGVRSSNLQTATGAAKGNRLSLDFNAHGLPNGRPAEFYQDLLAGPLRGYGTIGIESRDTYYLRGMYLRLMRAIEFMASQPEWDGKTIIASGTSQGGGQAIVAAGLDPRVTLVSTGCPTFCNLSGISVGEAGGFPLGLRKLSEKALSAVPYFDACYLVKRAKAAAVFRIGVIDETCWPAGMFAAYNAWPGRKVLVTAPTTHSPWCPPDVARQAQSKAIAAFRKLAAEEAKP